MKNQPTHASVCEIKAQYATPKGERKIVESEQIKSSQDSYKYGLEIWKQLTGHISHIESFAVLHLSRAHKVIGWSFISQGGLSGTVVDPKVVFQLALGSNASALILMHNHPSGNLNPSQADKQLTAKVVEAGEFLDIAILDHLIISSDGYHSFADNGEI